MELARLGRDRSGTLGEALGQAVQEAAPTRLRLLVPLVKYLPLA
jgi:hypothetical protein